MRHHKLVGCVNMSAVCAACWCQVLWPLGSEVPFLKQLSLVIMKADLCCFRTRLDSLASVIVFTLHANTHTHKSCLVSQRGAVAVRKDLQGPPVLPAVGWLEGLAVFVKVMGPRWANSQGTRSMLCHLRSTLVQNEVAGGGWGWRGEVSSSRALPKIPSALLHLLQLHLKVITRPAVSKQAPYGVSIVGLRLEPGEPSSTSLERRGLSKHS